MTQRPVSADRYTTATWLEREIQAVFARSWLLAFHSSEIGAPEAFSLFEIAGESVIVVRGRDGIARAFYNVCQHRGTLLCAQPRGSASALRCPYHHWEYALDGQLIRAPGAGAAALGAGGEGVTLRALHCAERFGFVWVSMAAQPADLDEYLAPVAPELSRYQPEGYRLETANEVAVAANWKASSDVNNESYHLATLHPELLEVAAGETEVELRGDHSVQTLTLGRPAREVGPEARVTGPLLQLLSALGVSGFPHDGKIADVRPAIARAFRERCRSVGVSLPDLDDERLAQKQQVHVFPNVQLNFTPFRLELYRHRPHPTDPSRCWFDEWSFGRPGSGPVPAPERRSFRHGQRDLGPVMSADVDMLPRLQAGMRSRGFSALRLTHAERAIAHMHDTLDRWLARGVDP